MDWGISITQKQPILTLEFPEYMLADNELDAIRYNYNEASRIDFTFTKMFVGAMQRYDDLVVERFFHGENTEGGGIVSFDIQAIKKVILKSINEFITLYQRNVDDYLFERDIKSHLFCILRNEVDLCTDNQPIKIGGHSLKLVYSEYGINRIDLVCIDPKNTLTKEKYVQLYKKNPGPEPLWDQPLLVGIEIKHIRLGYESKNNKIESCVWTSEPDLGKLDSYRKCLDKMLNQNNFEYLALCFIQQELTDNEIAKQKSKKVPLINEFNQIYVISKSSITRHSCFPSH